MRPNARGEQGVGCQRKLIQATASPKLFSLIHRAAAHSNISVSGFVRRALADHVGRIELPPGLASEIQEDIAGTLTWGYPSPVSVIPASQSTLAGEG
jgi:hypothetical protein